jgi:hypothetical protein
MILLPEKSRLLYQKLESDSPQRAWYEARIEQHDGGGYLIYKRSGSSRSEGPCEIWFRWSLADAVIKFQQVMGKKLKKRTGRIYTSSS